MQRLKQLEEFLKEDPNDPFNLYALALEYLKVDVKRAQDLFEDLIKEKPEYLPTYYPLAQLLMEQKDPRAEVIFKQGIDTAKRLNDLKTFKELSTAYNDWLFDQP